MKRFVETFNCIEGFHYYPNAPKICEYLSNNHRHMFVIRCKFEVSHNEREIEINTMQNEIQLALWEEFNAPCQFGDMSCESIAEWLLLHFNNMCYVKVLEDGYGGATLTR